MAIDETQYPGRKITLTIASVVAGAMAGVGVITGVAQTATLADGNVVLDTAGVYLLPVKGVTNAGAGSAVAVGDALFYSPGHTPTIDKDTTGVACGYALGTVGSSTTASINVKLKTL